MINNYLGAKVRRFLHTHNPLSMSYRIPQIWYFYKLMIILLLYLRYLSNQRVISSSRLMRFKGLPLRDSS